VRAASSMLQHIYKSLSSAFQYIAVNLIFRVRIFVSHAMHINLFEGKYYLKMDIFSIFCSKYIYIYTAYKLYSLALFSESDKE